MSDVGFVVSRLSIVGVYSKEFDDFLATVKENFPDIVFGDKHTGDDGRAVVDFHTSYDLDTVSAEGRVDLLQEVCEVAHDNGYVVKGNVSWSINNIFVVSVVNESGSLADFCLDFVKDSGVDNIHALRFMKYFYMAMRNKKPEEIESICEDMKKALADAEIKHCN